MSQSDSVGVGDIVEERHPAHVPWPAGRQRGEVIAADAESVTVRWQPWGDGQRIERDRIGNAMTDLIRPIKR